jgi:hypothetical protein
VRVHLVGVLPSGLATGGRGAIFPGPADQQRRPFPWISSHTYTFHRDPGQVLGYDSDGELGNGNTTDSLVAVTGTVGFGPVGEIYRPS